MSKERPKSGLDSLNGESLREVRQVWGEQAKKYLSLFDPNPDLEQQVVLDLQTLTTPTEADRLPIDKRETILGFPPQDERRQPRVDDERDMLYFLLCNHRLLKPFEERMLSKLFQAGVRAAKLEEQDKTTLQIRQSIVDGKAAETDLILYNQKLVVSMAEKKGSSFMTLSDRVQAGNLGLKKAIAKFDPDRGLKFSTYATWWIRQTMNRTIMDQDLLIRLPVHYHEAMHKVWTVMNEFETQGKKVTVKDLMQATGYTARKLERLSVFLERMESPLSFDQKLGESSVYLEDVLEAEEGLPEEVTTDVNIRENIETLLSGLKPNYAQVIRDRFGLNETQKIYTLEEIGRKLGLTRERIRQIERAALRRLRMEKTRLE